MRYISLNELLTASGFSPTLPHLQSFECKKLNKKLILNYLRQKILLRKIILEILINILIPLVLGLGIYIFLRNPSTHLHSWFHTNRNYNFVQSQLLIVLQGSLPDGLWLYSLLSSIKLIWKRKSLSMTIWLIVVSAMAIGSEILQKLGLLIGTFDWYDVLAYIIAILFFILKNFINKTNLIQMKKHFLTIATLSIFSFLFFASTPSKKIQNAEPLTVPDYSFTPPSTAKAGSAGIKIALFKPVFPGNFAYASSSPFNSFRTNMAKDLEQSLTAKGYILKGPFETYDEMMYSDKKECELGLFSDIDLNINQTSGGWKPTFFSTPNSPSYTFKGTITISGKITFYISETFTKQKLIVKSLSIPQQIDVEVESSHTYSNTGGNALPLKDPGVHNPIAKALVDFYKSTMKKAWDMTEVEELKNLKPQVKDIRANANFKAN